MAKTKNFRSDSKSLYRKVCNYSAKSEKEKAGWVNKVGRNSNSAGSILVTVNELLFNA